MVPEKPLVSRLALGISPVSPMGYLAHLDLSFACLHIDILLYICMYIIYIIQDIYLYKCTFASGINIPDRSYGSHLQVPVNSV